MNEFLPRTDKVAAVVSAGDRDRSGVKHVTTPKPVTAHTDTEDHLETQLREKSVVVASYAKLQADIANVVARLDPPRPSGASDALEADKAILALLPHPVVVLPMPPTDQHMVEFVAQVAQSVASQAALARAAQSRVSPAMVEAVMH